MKLRYKTIKRYKTVITIKVRTVVLPEGKARV